MSPWAFLFPVRRWSSPPVKAMYRRVAEDPHGEFHFEMGRVMAERLGYASPIRLRTIRSSALPVSRLGVAAKAEVGVALARNA